MPYLYANFEIVDNLLNNNVGSSTSCFFMFVVNIKVCVD